MFLLGSWVNLKPKKKRNLSKKVRNEGIRKGAHAENEDAFNFIVLLYSDIFHMKLKAHRQIFHIAVNPLNSSVSKLGRMILTEMPIKNWVSRTGYKIAIQFHGSCANEGPTVG